MDSQDRQGRHSYPQMSQRRGAEQERGWPFFVRYNDRVAKPDGTVQALSGPAMPHWSGRFLIVTFSHESPPRVWTRDVIRTLHIYSCSSFYIYSHHQVSLQGKGYLATYRAQYGRQPIANNHFIARYASRNWYSDQVCTLL